MLTVIKDSVKRLNDQPKHKTRYLLTIYLIYAQFC